VTVVENQTGPSFLVLRVGARRIALRREEVAELIASPQLFSFPHTTPLISGVVLRRGQVLPVLDLGPCVLGKSSPATRFFLVVERPISNEPEKCAIPVQGGCELVSGVMRPGEHELDFMAGWLDIDGDQIEVLDLERAIAAASANSATPAAEAYS
jgi:chemotaxis signal transduction protein